MMNEDSKKRLKAMAKAVAKLMKEQDEQKARGAAEAEDDDMDLAADMLMEACFPCCVVEVFCDDEF